MPDRFVKHRQNLASAVGNHGVAVVPAAAETIRNSDVHHSFRQDSDFVYLTGFHEPEAVAVIAPGHPDGDFTLFVRPRDREQEIWTGYRVGADGAKARFGADAAHNLDDLDSVLPRLLVDREVVYYRLGNSNHDDRMLRLVSRARAYHNRTGKRMPTTIADVSALLGEMRLRKSASEIESLRAACELSAEGHREAMRFARPGLYEYQVQAAMEYVWREAGSPRNGYPSIVASGPNACVLHYEENDREAEDGDLLLIDAACEMDYFSSDITRTFPVNGRFTGAQKAVYEIVLAAEKAGIHQCHPGATIRQIHDIARRVVTEGLVDLGLLPRGVEDSMAMHHYREFYMHGTSHWLGLDVHDAGSYRIEGKPRVLEAGMAFTVEPGIYVSSDHPEIELSLFEYDLDEWLERAAVEGPGVMKELEQKKKEAEQIRHPLPEQFLGIGVRIEDDILINTDGHEILSARVPRLPDEVEELCAEPSWLTRV
jgi:Xaa-Pro aminopeptidase